MRLRCAKTLWWFALLLLAANVIFSQLDRQSRYSPRFAMAVPDYFLSFGQAHLTTATSSAAPPVRALAEARTLVHKRPLPAEHLALLAAAQARLGKTENSVVSLELASRRGWRDRSTQRILLELAIQAGNGVEAARRFVALLAVDGNDALVITVAPRVFGTPGARSELARLSASEPRWIDRLRRVEALALKLGQEDETGSPHTE